MNRTKHLLCLTALLLTSMTDAGAADAARPEEPPKYRMELVYVFESNPPEFIFVIGNAGFRTVSALKAYLSTLPAGTVLEWAPGCVRFGGEPLLASPQEMEEFRAFCAERNITFVLVPSG